MNRVIKFRAWDEEKNEWYRPVHEAYKGNLWELLVSFKGDLSAHTMTGLQHESMWPERYALMQFTGLLDKNGKEIYEGDIIDHLGDVYEVRWNQEGFWEERGLSRKDSYITGEPYTISSGLLWNDANVSVIIGNIYENPNLV